jgi:PKD repeat protein
VLFLGWAAGGVGCGNSSSADTTSNQALTPPSAAFTVTPPSGPAPLAASFRDASTGDITQRTWSFGDGATSVETHPAHTYLASGTFSVTLTVTGPGGTAIATQAAAVVVSPAPVDASWRFAVVGDTHVPYANIIGEMVTSMIADRVSLVLVPGDIVHGGSGSNAAELRTQLATWKATMAPLYAAGIGVYPIRGNHEADVKGDTLPVWTEAFSGTAALPGNGPTGETNLTYSFTHKNALFLGLDEYVSLHRVNQPWVDQQLAAKGTRPHVFAFGHEPAFKAFHTDCLDDYPTERNAFWNSLAAAGARMYLSGHDHFFDVARIDDGDGDPADDLMQVVVGGGGGDLFDRYAYVGDNATFTPTNLTHDKSFGYLLVEVSGASDSDLGVTLSFKRRTVDPVTSVPSYGTTYTTSYSAPSQLNYPIVDTGQVACYNDTAEIPAPVAGSAYYGQDAQHGGRQPSFQVNGDGTVTDRHTGLTWVQARGPKLTWDQAVAGASTCRVGGYDDWRMPTIKELYSLINYTGAQGPSFTSTEGYLPFIDATAFEFKYGAGTSEERVIDCQDWSANVYVGTVMQWTLAAFGVNFADGRIKGYPVSGPTGTSHYVRYVRGNPGYGKNVFADPGDGTVLDTATGLQWTKADSGAGMDWKTALAWVQSRNQAGHLGYSDWRLPNAKELQSLVDYSRAPRATDPARRGPAIDHLFSCTSIIDEGGGTDYPFFWTSTSFKDGTVGGIPAAYLCFGSALGFMPTAGSTQLLDVHGAGAQRSDPKSGDPAAYPTGRGPQGDVVRIRNFVRLVRDATLSH